MAVAMKVKRCLAAFSTSRSADSGVPLHSAGLENPWVALRDLLALVLAFALLVPGSGAFAERALPSWSVPSSQAGVVPAWALPRSSPSLLGKAPVGSGPIEPELLRALLEAGSDDVLRVIVAVRGQPDLETAVGGALSAPQVRSRVVSALQASAVHSQAPLRAYLEGAQAAGLVESYTPFWILNAIAIRARPPAIRALAAHPTVAAVRLDRWQQWIAAESPKPKVQSPSPQTQTQTPGLGASDERSAIRNLQSDSEWGVARIRADQVWSSLHVSGTGAVVAGMDTGVDWLHPALQANYRGYNPHGPTNHAYSWYDATGGGALYPVDGHGHGSHTIGTVVGRGGIGVAPGARWVGVRVFNSQGYGYDSWIHAGFQWLLAPGGDPAKAPDVVNCSWSNDNGFLTTFQPDLRALRAAGIFTVLSAGNEGPSGGTVGSPASLPEAFAVGASDSDDEVAAFSSRGPSPWGDVRPHVVAPGVDVRSSTPGGAYHRMNGTSMAAPHVSGVVALLRSVSPTLGITRATFLITSTAVPLGDPIPNNDAGWGRVDAFAAVAAVAQPGLVTGTVARVGNGTPVAGALVVAAPREGGGAGRATTDDDGAYLLALAPAAYDLTVSAFGYESATAWGVRVMAATTSVVDFSLAPLPTGILGGRVTDAATGRPLAATVSVSDTPLETVASVFAFALPADTYTLRARSLGYRVVSATAAVTVGQATVVDLALPPAPSVLLVDSGSWYYGSQAGYFRQALDDLATAYDERTIKHLPDDIPSAADLAAYDVVVWSAPQDAPGYIGAQSAITGYLSAGGQLFLTGQDIGFWDGGGPPSQWSPYYRDYLKARYVDDNAPTRVLEGIQGDLFAGLTLTITGSGGADNQSYPDQITVADSDAAAPLLTYQGDGFGGMWAGTCLDYRAIYLSFGFEAIDDRAARRDVMGRALDWLVSPRLAAGLELKPSAQTRIGLPGSVVTHALRVRNVGQAATADTVGITLDGASWATQLSAPSLSLASCTSATVVVTVTVPFSAGWDVRDAVTLTARSSLSSTLAETAVLTTKAPAPILLVDDDRWYDQEEKYQAALADRGLAYDYWPTGRTDGNSPRGGPPSDVLGRYPVVLWFTGYDWYAPVTDDEEAALTAYLDAGGRLFLSSQDFLYYHHDSPFSRDYLGVITYTEDVTPTLARGVPGDPVGDRLGPYALDYPFRNWSDALVPAPGTAVPFRDQERRPIALARHRADVDYRTIFFSFPFETLPAPGRAEVMERAVGWLSWLGSSTFVTDRDVVSGGDTLTYTVALRNDGPAVVSTSLSNTLPLSLTVVPGSLTGPAVYYTPARRVSWEGVLGPGAAITFTYQAAVAADLPAGALVANMARLGLEDQQVHFRRAAVVQVSAPDLSPSDFQCGPSPARPGSRTICKLVVANAGLVDAPAARVTNLLPAGATLVSGSVVWVGGGTLEVLTGTVRWIGPLATGAEVTLTYGLVLPAQPLHPPLYSVAILEDGVGGAWERPTWLLLEPRQTYLPVVARHE
jgi:uncharacterized repeat protein (TIGR01451 family)